MNGKDGRTRLTIQERSYLLGLRVMKMVRELPKDISGQIWARQIARSGTSIGSNAEEAAAGHSRKEFIQKLNLSRKEARETHYWMRMIGDLGLVSRTRLSPLLKENAEIIAILTAAVKTARRNAGD